MFTATSQKRTPNQSQYEAITFTDAPLLIIAGPGSGKTFTLVERVLYLITQKQLQPENLFVATFTEKAASEIITRISNRLLESNIKFNVYDMYIGTIHSICLKILEDYREYTRLGRNYTVMDQFDQQYFLYQRMSDYDNIEGIENINGGEDNSRWQKSEYLLKWINKISEENINIDALLKSEDIQLIALANCYECYQKQLEETNTLDFSTIQLEAYRLLDRNPDVLKKLQEKIRYLMIDEYQDTNTIQESILLKIAGNNSDSKICVVGDDDQGLYRFRGATIRNILEFPDNFPKDACKQVKLTTNYRSHPDIINFYNTWMDSLDWNHRGITFRFDKTVEPQQNKSFPDIPSVFKVSGSIGQDNWKEELLDFLHHLRTNILTDFNQVAFLFSSVKNDKVKDLSDFLEQHSIPVYSPRSDMFFERQEIQLLIGSYLFLFRRYGQIRQWDDNIHLHIWEYYDSCLKKFADCLRQNENRDLLRWCQIKAKEIYNLSHNTDYGFSGLFYELLQFPLFSRYLVDETATGVIDGRPLRNIAIFSNLLIKFEYLHHITILNPKYLDRNLIALFNQYIRFLYDGGIGEYEDKAEYAPKGCISFMTIHQSKGLEFPVVVVGSLNTDPRKQYTELDEKLQKDFYQKPPFEPIEKTKYYDFWRKFYTAFSRAQNFLILTCQEKESAGRGTRRVPSKAFQQFYNPLESWRNIVFDKNIIELETVKNVNIKNEYSFTSHILLYENCPQQYRFFKELEFSPVRQNPMLFGSLVHQTIEDVHKAVLRGEEHIVCNEKIESWFHTNYINLTKKERVYLAPLTQEAALKHVKRYVNKAKNNWASIKEAEVEVALVKDSYILKGQVDLIRGEHDTVEIIDFKSEKKPDLNNNRDALEKYRRQLEIYAHLVEEKYGHNVSKMHLYYTSEKDGNPMVSFKKDSKNIDKTIEVIDKTVAKIEKKDFALSPENRQGKLCGDCDMRHYCNATI